jgi:hypothetical protein
LRQPLFWFVVVLILAKGTAARTPATLHGEAR